MVKIVTIGGGSSYTPELMEGFIKRYDELPIKEIWFVDIEEGKEKLEIINKFSTKLEREELIEKLTAEVDNYTLDEIKNELGQALVEQLSAEEEAESNDTDSNFSLNINIADNSLGNSAWDLVKRHKANK